MSQNDKITLSSHFEIESCVQLTEKVCRHAVASFWMGVWLKIDKEAFSPPTQLQKLTSYMYEFCVPESNIWTNFICDIPLRYNSKIYKTGISIFFLDVFFPLILLWAWKWRHLGRNMSLFRRDKLCFLCFVSLKWASRYVSSIYI